MLQIKTNFSISNSTTQLSNNNSFSIATSYFGIIIIGLGLVFNTLTFLIFRLDKELKKMPSIVILSFVCVTDTLSLFTWNLNHFLIKYNIQIEGVSILSCKIFSFMQYTSLEISGLLLSLCTIDRYFTIASKPGSLFSKLPFGTFRTSLIWSISVISFICLLNSYLLFSDRLIKYDNTYKCYTLSNGFKIIEKWEKIHLFLYSFFPFVIMTVFNILLIRIIKVSKKVNSVSVLRDGSNNNHQNKKNLTSTLLIISFLFLLMTLPSTIAFSFLIEIHDNNQTAKSIFHLLDYLSFLYHTTLFFNCFMTNLKFRNFVFNKFKNILELKL